MSCGIGGVEPPGCLGLRDEGDGVEYRSGSGGVGAAELDALVSTSALFDGPADRPTHTDEWADELPRSAPYRGAWRVSVLELLEQRAKECPDVISRVLPFNNGESEFLSCLNDANAPFHRPRIPACNSGFGGYCSSAFALKILSSSAT